MITDHAGHVLVYACVSVTLHCSACLLISRVSNAFEPAQLVVAHGPQTHSRQHISGQQRMVCWSWQGHVQGLQLLGHMDSGVNVTQLLLTVCLQTCTCLHTHSNALGRDARPSQESGVRRSGGVGGKAGEQAEQGYALVSPPPPPPHPSPP